ncbi:MAG: hypothetical protein GY711_34860 [bacterium]|nr:hypothetical protein [bacterium]
MRPATPQFNNVRTFYERPLLDRWTGRYTAEWENADGVHRKTVHNRLRDFEGNAPSLHSLLRLPRILRTYLASRRRPILAHPVPFLVLDAVLFLDEILEPGMRVLEVGGGNSTLWFLERGAQVTTIEHSPEWAREIERYATDKLGAEAAARLDLHVCEGVDAIERIERLGSGTRNLALIDCKNAHTWRRDCVAAARPKLRSRGWMVLDNSDHPNNWSSVELMSDLERVRFTGFAPMCPVVTQTSFWQVKGSSVGVLASPLAA